MPYNMIMAKAFNERDNGRLLTIDFDKPRALEPLMNLLRECRFKFNITKLDIIELTRLLRDKQCIIGAKIVIYAKGLRPMEQNGLRKGISNQVLFENELIEKLGMQVNSVTNRRAHKEARKQKQSAIK
jgi:hypothetical protein